MKHIVSILPILAVVLVTSASSECAGIFGVDCTLIGCSDGLGVGVTGGLRGLATVQVVADGEQRTFGCDPAYPCMAFFEGWSPAEVDVHVAWDGGDFSARAAADYKLFYPNGRRCGPECRQAFITIPTP